MKRIAVFLFACMISSVVYSQENYWTPVASAEYWGLSSAIFIDGVQQTSDQIEVGAFCGQECRGSSRIEHRIIEIPNGPTFENDVALIKIYGEAGDLITFKLYDHTTNKVMDLNSPEPIAWDNNITYGTMTPYEILFTTPAPQPSTYTLDITAWTEAGGYYLIASPVGEVSPGDVTNMIPAEGEGDFDLYYFDQSQQLEWINIKDGNTPLQPGKGYLYAREQGATLTFSGTPITESPYQVSLVYDENADLPGWNLIGNPFATQASLDRSYYKLNAEGSEVSATLESEAINAMQGVFVHTDAAGTAEFTTGSKTTQHIALNLVRNDRSASLVDRAVVRFDEGGQLPKFMLDATNTRVYIPQDGANYAVANHNSDNNTAVSFKAKENGSYTLKVSVENLDLEYLHLIDNQTGTDVDLLATPSYTFDANTTDQADRFRLVYAETTGIDENNNFAYFNGKTWNVNNEGQATLQVMDITGRTISSQTISGNAELTLDQPAGVYVLRLINGNDTKVQKVVVR